VCLRKIPLYDLLKLMEHLYESGAYGLQLLCCCCRGCVAGGKYVAFMVTQFMQWVEECTRHWAGWPIDFRCDDIICDSST